MDHSQAWDGGSATWNALMRVVQSLITMEPKEIFPDAWQVATETILPWFMGAGGSLLTIFFLIGFLRQNTNIKENMTMETFIENMIKLIVAYTLLANCLPIMEDFLSLATTATRFIAGTEFIEIENPYHDVGSTLFYITFILPIAYFFISIVCGIQILLTVLKRVAYVLFCIVAMPIGAAAFAGGKELEQVGRATVRTFLTYCFQITLIALWLRLGSLMASGISVALLAQTNDSGLFNGFFMALNNVACMLFMTALIKSSDELLKRAFDLR